VEGALRAGIVRAGIAPGPGAGTPDVASRTDRGVHARGNAVALSSELRGPALLGALNGMSGELYFSHARSVPADFHPRQAQSRWYRYFEPAEGHDLGRWKEAAAHLTGPLDGRSFGRGMPSGAPAIRIIDRIEVTAQGDRFEIDVHARSFVWGMVRKIVAALRAFDAGDLTGSALEGGARGRRRISLPMAEPEGLVLWEVVYPEPWECAASGPSDRQVETLTAARRGLRVRGAVIDALEGISPTGPRGKSPAGL